jgi:hypothetical protein
MSERFYLGTADKGETVLELGHADYCAILSFTRRHADDDAALYPLENLSTGLPSSDDPLYRFAKSEVLGAFEVVIEAFEKHGEAWNVDPRVRFTRRSAEGVLAVVSAAYRYTQTFPEDAIFRASIG